MVFIISKKSKQLKRYFAKYTMRYLYSQWRWWWACFFFW